MNLQTKMPTTADEFLRWNEGREGKREFVRGRVVEMMINVTRNHARLAARLLVALANRLDATRFDVGSADFGVKTADGVRYPDIFVDRRTSESRGTDLSTTEPMLLAEILSSSSYTRDFGEKVSDYTALPSLFYYVVLSQEEPHVWVWSRMADAWSGPTQITGIEAMIELPVLGISVGLSELYKGIAEPTRA